MKYSGEVVGGEHHGLALRGEAAHRGPEAVAGLDVEPNRRLVEHKQLRIADQRKGETRALHLATGELLRALFGEAEDSRELEHVTNTERPGIQRRHHGHQLAHREAADQGPRLQHRANLARGDRLVRVGPEARDGAGVGLREAEQHVQGGRLACPVGAEQGNGLAALDRQVDPADSPHGTTGTAEGLDQALERDGTCHVRCHASSSCAQRIRLSAVHAAAR
jgi:hypothetical protein